jgi:hypothetical protein
MIFNKTRNIGDDIQSYAAMKYLPKVDYYVDRENLDSFVPNFKEKVAVIMNGWYMHYTLNWPPSPYIKPLPISMHFTSRDFWNIKNEETYLSGFGAEYLRSISPIGCRDTHTLELLSKKNIKAQFTGCLTLTLDKFPDAQKEDYICAVDVSKKVLEKIKENTNLEIKEITHILPEDYCKLSWEERVKQVENLLKIYQSAQCVITTRLHCALPCTALGTPVLIIHNKYDDDRFKDYLEFINFCYETDFLDGTYTYNFLNPPVGKTEYLKIRANLKKICENFIQECETSNMSDEAQLLPDNIFYTNYVVAKSNWFKGLALNLEKKVKVFENNNLKYKDKIDKLNSIITELNYRLEHIQKIKRLKICERLYKAKNNRK